MTADQDRLATLNTALEAARLLRIERDALCIERDALRKQVAAYEERFGLLGEGFASKVPLVHATGITCDWPEPEPPVLRHWFGVMAALVTAAAVVALLRLWVAL
jgi:hypothetical protein